MMLLMAFGIFIVILTLWVTAPLFCNVTSTRYSAWGITLIPFVVATLFLYSLFGHERAWHQWQQHGRAHYELMAEVQQLGGLPGLIQGVNARLAQNPNDVQGWQLLAKLYTANHEPEKAAMALQQAKHLQQQM